MSDDQPAPAHESWTEWFDDPDNQAVLEVIMKRTGCTLIEAATLFSLQRIIGVMYQIDDGPSEPWKPDAEDE